MFCERYIIFSFFLSKFFKKIYKKLFVSLYVYDSYCESKTSK